MANILSDFTGFAAGQVPAPGKTPNWGYVPVTGARGSVGNPLLPSKLVWAEEYGTAVPAFALWGPATADSLSGTYFPAAGTGLEFTSPETYYDATGPATVSIQIGTDPATATVLATTDALYSDPPPPIRLTATVPLDYDGTRPVVVQFRSPGWEGGAWSITSPALVAVVPVTVMDPGPQALTVGVEYALQLEAAPAGSSWTASALPSGLTLTTAGLVAGTPATSGVLEVTFTATVGGQSDTQSVTFTTVGGAVADPWAEFTDLATALAPRVAAFVGRPGDADLTATALAQLPVVAEYVRGHTRGRGWIADVPASPLRAVIVSAAARLAINPEQVTMYTTNDYTERPAVLSGWTLPELSVLRRYRRVSA